MNLTEELNEYFPVWQKLNPAQQHLLEHSVQKRRFMKGENVHGSGKSCLGFLIIKTGQMRAYILSEAGREVTLYHVYEREMCLFSASCKMQNIQFDIYVDAEKDTEVLQIPTTIFYSLMNESLPMARFTNDLMATHLTDVMWLIEQILLSGWIRGLRNFFWRKSVMRGVRLFPLRTRPSPRIWERREKW